MTRILRFTRTAGLMSQMANQNGLFKHGSQGEV
jgi:hypothetical protein